MRKAVIACACAETAKNLRHLISWDALDVEIVGEATDGIAAAEIIRNLRPDLVLSEICLPGKSGLELLAEFGGKGFSKFIFISRYKRFEYVREALSGGAVEYIVKPVSSKVLEKAVKKALVLMEEQDAAMVLRQSSLLLHPFFSQITENREVVGSDLISDFSSLLGGKDEPVFIGLCFRLTEEAQIMLESMNYERRLLQTFIAFNAIRDDLEHRGYACFLRKDESKCCMLGIFSPWEDPISILRDSMTRVSAKTGLGLIVGMGRTCRNAEELHMTYEDSMVAADMHYFRKCDVISYNGEAHVPKATNEEFDAAVNRVFHSIVTKSSEMDAAIDDVLDIIRDLHMGNRQAAFNRAMVFTGDLCQLLFANRLLGGSFTERQDALQHSLESCRNFEQLRLRLKEYYEELKANIYSSSARRSTEEIYKVQQFVLEHYNEEISIKTLSEIACVSPRYFSAYFKAETGQNYKAFLTGIRMENALKMVLNTNLKTYEIAEKVGYNNVRRFVDAFRSIYDMSPADYRKKHKNQ